jgi:hypothetical protein
MHIHCASVINDSSSIIIILCTSSILSVFCTGRGTRHIGVTLHSVCREGKALEKRSKSKDMLDMVLQRNDNPGLALRTIYDPYNDEQLTLSHEELRVLMNIQQGKMPDVHIEPYEDLVDWYSNVTDTTPMQNGPEPKRRFMPSKWEEKKIVKLVRLSCCLPPCATACRSLSTPRSTWMC